MSNEFQTRGMDKSDARRWVSDWRLNAVLLAFLAIAGFFLISEHRTHLFGFLPFLLLLACPLLHVFMHSGHGGHDQKVAADATTRATERAAHPH
jgi:hypothetical protein